MLFSATLPGREPAAQRMTGDHSSILINTEAFHDALAAISQLGPTIDFAEMLTMSEDQLKSHGERLEQSMQNVPGDLDEPYSDWSQCVTDEHGCDIGTLHLEHASHDHLSGHFSFRVYRGDLQYICGIDVEQPREYANVSGFMNITSAQTQTDNSLIDFLSRGERPGELFYIPGIENLLQGGSLFTD